MTLWGLGSHSQKALGEKLINDHVGSLQCRGCHEKEYQIWAKSAHARAYQRLPVEHQQNRLCLRCHSTGKATHLQGVQCESCHGPGRFYAQEVVMKDARLARAAFLKVVRGQKGCVECHNTNSPKLRAFDFQPMWQKIAHGLSKTKPPPKATRVYKKKTSKKKPRRKRRKKRRR